MVFATLGESQLTEIAQPNSRLGSKAVFVILHGWFCNMKMLIVGSKQNSRNSRLANALERGAIFDFEFVPWLAFANAEKKLEMQQYDVVRYACPYFEEGLDRYLFDGMDAEIQVDLLDADQYSIYSMMNFKEKRFNALLYKCQSMTDGIIKLNSEAGIINADDKSKSSAFLRQCSVSVPNEIVFDSIEQLDKFLLNTDSRRFVIKPRNGAMSFGMFLIEKTVDGFSVSGIERNKKSFFSGRPARDYLENAIKSSGRQVLQEYVDSKTWDGQKVEFRVFYVMGRAFISHCWVASPIALTSNPRDGGLFTVGPILEHYVPSAEFHEFARKLDSVSRIFGLHTFAMDAVYSTKGDIVVLEINPFPGDYFLEKTGFNPYRIEVERLNQRFTSMATEH